jgi:hypothetical protein
MNKIIFKSLVAAGVMVLAITSCKKNNLVVDKSVTPPAFVKFNVAKAGDTLKTYYINSANTPLKIPIGISTVSDKDRTIQLCYSSLTAVAGVQYTTPPATIVIPAGKTVDSLSLQGLFSGYPLSTRKDTLRIKICGGDVPVSDYWSTYTVVMRKYCDVVLANLAGNYSNTNEYTSSGAFSYGPYTTAVSNVVSTGATTATAKISNLYDDGWNDVTANFDWTDPGNFTVTIPLQLTGRSYAGGPGGPTSVRTTAGQTNTFSSCDRSISISIDLVNGGTTVITSNYKFVLK